MLGTIALLSAFVSLEGNEHAPLARLSVSSVPRIENQAIALSLPNVISDTLEGDDEGLISDFYGWRATSYVALLTRLHPDRIFLAPGEPNVEPDLRSLSAFLDEYPRGVVVLVTGSRFSDMVGKTLAGEAKAWRYGVGLQPVYSVEWPEPGKDPKNPSLEIFRYQVEGR